MTMGIAALQHIVKQSTKRLAAGHRGTPMTNLPASRALDDLHHDLTDEEQTARRKAWDRSPLAAGTGRSTSRARGRLHRRP
ncbi:hypothetical protein ACWDZ8_02895 [Streptomyces sp. NPDC003233]